MCLAVSSDTTEILSLGQTHNASHCLHPRELITSMASASEAPNADAVNLPLLS